MSGEVADGAGDARNFARYARRIASAHGYTLDSAQLAAISRLDRLQRELVESEQGGRSLLKMFLRQGPVRGLYLWGGVGRGKSFLMDMLFESVPISRKVRVHFHRFMQDIHRRLQAMQGTENPLLHISRDLSRQIRLLCLDEFHVTDIGDAMLMRNLLQGLLDHGVVIVTTSNLHPDQLYLHGLQRAQFLPAIELLKTRLDVIEIDGGADYRLRVLEKEGVYHSPLDNAAKAAMEETFVAIAGVPGASGASLEVEGRVIPALRVAPGVGWFDFAALCDGPRGAADYIELGRRFHTVLISGVRAFGATDADRRRRFTLLVDEFYDRRVKLIISAEAGVLELFRHLAGGPEVDRTASRLVEMQTRQYLAEPHLS
jgi:cell division protein ZapE